MSCPPQNPLIVKVSDAVRALKERSDAFAKICGNCCTFALADHRRQRQPRQLSALFQFNCDTHPSRRWQVRQAVLFDDG
jgi:hypothetical protein